MKKYVLNIVGCMLLSIVCSLFLLQQSTYVKHRIGNALITLLEHSLAIKVTAKNILINFFTLSIIIEEGTVKPSKQPQTSWKFNLAKISFNPLSFFTKQAVEVSLNFHKVNGITVSTKDSIELIDHIIDLVTPQSAEIPIVIKKIFLTAGKINVKRGNDFFDASVNGTFSFGEVMQDNTEVWQGCLLLDHGDIFFNGTPILEDVSGSNIFYYDKNKNAWHTRVHNTIKKILNEEPRNYVLTGSWCDQERIFLFQEETQRLNLKAILNDDSAKIEGNIAAKTIARLFDFIQKPQKQLSSDVNAHCTIDLALTQEPTQGWECKGIISLDKPSFKDMTCEHLFLKNVFINQEIVKADLEIRYDNTYAAYGNGCWDQAKQEGTISLANTNEIITARRPGSPAYWSIHPQQLTLALHLDNKGDMQGSYQAQLRNSMNEETKNIEGDFYTHADAISFTGKAHMYDYQIDGICGTSPHLTKISCTQQGESAPLIDFLVQNDSSNTLHGYAQYKIIQYLLPADIKNKVLGKNNKLFASLKQNNFNVLEGKLWLENSKFFIPSIQNMIKNGQLDFTFNTDEKKLIVQNATIDFARGKLQAAFASCEFNQETWALQSLYMPISVNDMLLNIKRDFYSFVYGNLFLQQKNEEKLNLFGTLVMRKTLIQGDVFSDVQTTASANPLEQFQEFNKECDFSIRLINEQPIIIKTQTIEALAHIDLQASHKYNPNVEQLPYVTGTINLNTGHLKFLENNLKIEYGKIQFLTRQLDDPVIDLIAKNRINKYVVTLQVTGSLKKPTVILESTPELSEEQILGLLFTGSENTSLQTDLPVMIMQNLNTILLGHRKPYDKTSILLDTLSKPFKYVQITPDLTDQTGRSGVRASVSLPLTKQLRAQFQKNLSFDEDLGVEIDYLLSDDINLKLVKDQRGELGSEVEVRFKF